MRTAFIASIITIIIVMFAFLIWRYFGPHYDEIELSGFSSSDAKLGYDGYVVTSKNDHLNLVNTRTSEVKETFIRSNWIDAMTTDNVIVYTNNDRKTGICHFDPKDGSIINHYEIMNDGLFRIDPSIVRLNDVYLLSTTGIIGKINKTDENNYQGYYVIQLYKSYDLKDWEYVTDIYSGYENLEDVELNDEGNSLRITFEKETRDKGPSSILTMVSDDYGQTWSDAKTLVENGADNEPASFLRTNSEYWLFYSSDINNPGGSYESAEAYLLRLSTDLEAIATTRIPLKSQNQILLYQAIIDNDEVTLLYARDYLGNDDLLLENMPLNEVVLNST